MAPSNVVTRTQTSTNPDAPRHPRPAKVPLGRIAVTAAVRALSTRETARFHCEFGGHPSPRCILDPPGEIRIRRLFGHTGAAASPKGPTTREGKSRGTAGLPTPGPHCQNRKLRNPKPPSLWPHRGRRLAQRTRGTRGRNPAARGFADAAHGPKAATVPPAAGRLPRLASALAHSAVSPPQQHDTSRRARQSRSSHAPLRRRPRVVSPACGPPSVLPGPASHLSASEPRYIISHEKRVRVRWVGGGKLKVQG